MHSRIFQVSIEPIEEENLIEDYRYEDGFVGSHADYVVKETSETDIESDLEWLQEATKGLEVDKEKKTLKILSKEDYFKNKHEKFKELADELSYISLEDFISNEATFSVEDLKSAFEEKRGFYIDDNDEYIGIANLDNWIRNAEENKTYYIGNIFDYHF